MERLTEREPYWLGEEFWTHAMEPTDEEIESVYEKLRHYENLEEQGKLLVMAYEVCEISECPYCNHTERRIEETWIRPELLGGDGFYKTKKEAEAALEKMRESEESNHDR